MAAVQQDQHSDIFAAEQRLGVGEKKDIFIVVMTIIYSVAISDMIFGLRVKAEFEPLTKQQLALKAEGHYLQNVRSLNCFSVTAHRVR